MMAELPHIPEGTVWFYADASHSEGLTRELRSEIGPLHPLFNFSERLVVIAKCAANDDVLALDTEDKRSVFCVHLTWAGKHDRIPTKYPSFLKVPDGDLSRFFRDY